MGTQVGGGAGTHTTGCGVVGGWAGGAGRPGRDIVVSARSFNPHTKLSMTGTAALKSSTRPLRSIASNAAPAASRSASSKSAVLNAISVVATPAITAASAPSKPSAAVPTFPSSWLTRERNPGVPGV